MCDCMCIIQAPYSGSHGPERFDHAWVYMLILDSLHVYTDPRSIPSIVTTARTAAIAGRSRKIRADISIRVRALIRMWANQGIPAIPVWAARMRTSSPYVYGLRKMAHMRMGSPYTYGKNTCMGRNTCIQLSGRLRYQRTF